MGRTLKVLSYKLFAQLPVKTKQKKMQPKTQHVAAPQILSAYVLVTTAPKGGDGLSAGKYIGKPVRRTQVACAKYRGCRPCVESVE